MGRPRLPAEVAAVTGADQRSPGRFAGRAAPKVKSLGPAPKRYTPEQVEIWDEFNEDFPWLGRSDRTIVDMAVMVKAKIIDTGDEATASMFAQMRLLLSSLGGTPVDRTKVAKPDDDDDDPANEFFN